MSGVSCRGLGFFPKFSEAIELVWDILEIIPSNAVSDTATLVGVSSGSEAQFSLVPLVGRACWPLDYVVPPRATAASESRLLCRGVTSPFQITVRNCELLRCACLFNNAIVAFNYLPVISSEITKKISTSKWALQ